MAVTPLKVVALTVGVSGVGLGGYGVFYVASVEETIGAHLVSKFKNTDTVFLHLGHEEWSKRYSKVPDKPKNTEGRHLNLEEVKSWCTDSVKKKFTTEDDSLYIQVREICFANTKTLLQASGSARLKSVHGSDHQEWANAWNSYNSGKEIGPKIELSGYDADLNGEDSTKGAKALHDWCNGVSIKKMYEVDSFLKAFKAWCV